MRDAKCPFMKKICVDVKIAAGMNKFNEPWGPYPLSLSFIPSCCHLHINRHNGIQIYVTTASSLKVRGQGESKKCQEVNYHSFKNWLDALGFMIIIPKTELFPGSWKENLTPGSNQLVKEESSSIIQVHFVPMFT